ncbi:MAG: tRNA pseudouridine(55) synthase TruB [Acidobacteria bacterium]|nr:MAG: tRNA pseudouridine(55) synthase TruB [Acidobacteriota bacterium]
MTEALDGVLVVDKPAGPTSHDVVARLRKALATTRIGHTGTLDPMATGVLPLVVGRATRLSRFLSASEKEYRAEIRLGYSTDTDDATGEPLGASAGNTGPVSLPSPDAIAEALRSFVGVQTQEPPAYSAKKVGGVRSYARARGGMAVRPAAVAVTVERLDLLAVDRDVVAVSLVCSAGFYVRSLARDLGARLGTGAHLASLRRLRSGEFSEREAIPLEAIQADPGAAAAGFRQMDLLLTHLPYLSLTDEGVRRARSGQDMAAEGSAATRPYVRLVAVAEPSARPGFLHPCIVLV